MIGRHNIPLLLEVDAKLTQVGQILETVDTLPKTYSLGSPVQLGNDVERLRLKLRILTAAIIVEYT